MGFSFCRADVRHGAGKFAVGRIPETLKPGDERLIVVRTGVCDGGLGVEVGAVVVAVAECELENAHPGKFVFVAQSDGLRGLVAEVFGDDWDITKAFADRGEQLAARNGQPFAVDGVFRAAGTAQTR